MTLYLLDTHAFIWWLLDDPALSLPARSVVAAGEGNIVVSAVSLYEIANKARSRRWLILSRIVDDIDQTLTTEHFGRLALSDRHALRAGLLPGRHRDAFDRMIAAQALVEDMTVVTCDRQIAAFGCRTLW